MMNAAALSLSVALLCCRRIGTAATIIALQALCSAVSLGEAATAAAIVAFVLNGGALPFALVRVNHAQTIEPTSPAMLSWIMASALLAAAIIILGQAGADETVIVGASVALFGLLLALRSHPGIAVLGLLSAQNGLILVASGDHDLPALTALAVAVPVVPALVLGEKWLHR
jgi:hydrogenase-4 component E